MEVVGQRFIFTESGAVYMCIPYHSVFNLTCHPFHSAFQHHVEIIELNHPFKIFDPAGFSVSEK